MTKAEAAPPARRVWRGGGLLFAALMGCGLAACDQVAALGVTSLVGGGDLVRIPVRDAAGEDQMLTARLCRPDGDAPAPVALLAHGLPPRGTSRADMSPASCASPPARWFRARGYLVVLALRRGYGESEGGWAEDPGACASPDYRRAGLEGARDLDAVLAFAQALPNARPDGAVIVGEDAGGWDVLAYASAPHKVPAVLVDIAGGMGARAAGDGGPGDGPGHVCRPDLLIDAAAGFGATARAPVLWIDPANDSVFPTAVVTAIHAAFTGAGGRATLLRPDAPGTDGHDMLFDDAGVAVWGPPVGEALPPR